MRRADAPLTAPSTATSQGERGEDMRNYLTEFIGTFFLCLTIGLTVIGGTPLAPLAIGASLMVMVYMGGHISGGHYNPAVSLAVLMRGKVAIVDFVIYVIVQVAGAIVAAMTVHYVTGKAFEVAPGPGVSFVHALLVKSSTLLP